MDTDLNNSRPGMSHTIYDWLLLAYPRGHREAYGSAMRQLFRDQYRDAWSEAGIWGVTKLWLNILPDLVNSSIIERLASFRERKTMSDKLANLSTFRGNSPLTTFSVVFTVVFLMVLITTVAITYILPETYASTARMKIAPDVVVNNGTVNEFSYDPYFIQTTFEIIQSQMVLDNVVGQLDLNHTWGKKYNNGQPFTTGESRELLKNCLSLSPVRDTQLVAVTAFSQDKLEAAKIANGVVNAYMNYRQNIRRNKMNVTLDALHQAYNEQSAEISDRQGELDQMSQKAGIPVGNESLPELLGRLDKERGDAQQVYQQQQAMYNQLQGLSQPELRQMLPSLIPDSTLAALLDQLAEAQRQHATLANDYSPTQPVMARNQSLETTLNQQIDDRVNGILVGLKAQLDSKHAQVAALNDRIDSIKSAKDYWAARDNMDQIMDAHKLLFAKIEAEKLDDEIPQSPLVEIIDQAEPGMYPMKPNKPLNITIGGMIGVVVGSFAGGLAVLISTRTRKPPVVRG